jgi:2-C-methyl-D-erythritol 4-phosphate cytidylyltransferase
VHLLIAAAGSGRRMGADRNKLLLTVAGRPVLSWTLEAALACGAIRWIGLVGQPVDRLEVEALVESLGVAHRPIVWIDGGASRQESVRRGLAALPPEAEHVLIHDGARCLVEPQLLERCAAAVRQGQAVIAAIPVSDTIKLVDAAGTILDTPDRSHLWAAQTPQGFAVERLRAAHEQATEAGWSVTDDASLFERLGWPVRVLEAEPSNIKVTTPFDLRIAEAMLAARTCSPKISPTG